MKTMILLAALFAASFANAEEVSFKKVLSVDMAPESYPDQVSAVRFSKDGNAKLGLAVDFKVGAFAENPVCVFSVFQNSICSFEGPPTYQGFEIRCINRYGVREFPESISVICSGEKP